MNPTILLGLIAGAPVVLLMILRINATLVFLSLCLGDVLVQSMGGDAHSLLDLAAQHGHSTNQATIELGLLLLPVVLTMIFMIRSVHGSKLLWNILPALGVGLVGALLAVPLLPGGVSYTISGTSAWHQLQMAESLILGVTTLICLFFLWMQRSKKAEGRGKHHK